MEYEEIVKELKKRKNPENVAGMARFGINPKGTLGVRIWDLRIMAKKIGKNHELALKLWDSKIHEARLLASMIDEPDLVTEKQMEKWVSDFDSWDICDQVCTNLFDITKFAYRKVDQWTKRDEEFVKRAGFVLIVGLVVHDKNAKDEDFIKYFNVIKKESTDERNYVKKAVSWALRQVGKKRSKMLNELALKTAKEILKIDSPSAQFIAKDTIRELESEKIQKRLL